MKKARYLVPLVFALTACGPSGVTSSDIPLTIPSMPSVEPSSSSSSDTEVSDFEQLLEGLSIAYRMEGSMEERSGAYGSTTYSTMVEATSEAISYLFVNERTGSEAIRQTYVEGEDGNLYSSRLTLDNTHVEISVYNASVGGPMRFAEDGYKNAFQGVSAGDFEENEAGEYVLTSTDESLLFALSTQLYGNPGYPLKSFLIKPDGEGWAYEGYLDYGGGYNADVVGSISPILESEFTHLYPVRESVEDPTFEAGKEKLQAYDFTLTQTDYEDGVRRVSTYISNESGVYYSTSDAEGSYEFAYLLTDEGLIREVEKVDGTWTKTDDPVEGNLREVRPSFAFDRAVFEKNGDGSYSPVSRIEGDLTTFSIFYAAANSFRSLSISFADSEIVMYAEWGEDTTELVFNDFGTSELPISLSELA